MIASPVCLPLQLPKKIAQWSLTLLLFVLPTFGQERNSVTQKAIAKSLSYEAVLIKPDESGISYWRNTADGFSVGSMPVSVLIRAAFGLTEDQLVGLPRWASSERFEIQAKSDVDTATTFEKLPPMERVKQTQRMMQLLLTERFALKAHRTVQVRPLYELGVAKGGCKMKKSFSDIGGNANYSDGKVEAHSVSMDNFVMNMSRVLGRTTVNKTGLAGGYDVALEWAPDGTDPSDPRPSIFTAFEEQLGLKLVAAKGPVDILVIDHVERPTEN